VCVQIVQNSASVPLMPSALHGRIFHRLKIPKSSSDVPVSKKNRPKTKYIERGSTAAAAAAAPTGKPVNDDKDISSENRQLHHSCGFIFIASTDSYDESSPRRNKEYLLSLPRDLLKLACDAVRSEREVIIRRYTEISLIESLETITTDDKKSTIFDNNIDYDVSTSSSSSSTTTYSMIEVHEKGLEVLPSSHQEEPQTTQQQNQYFKNANNSSSNSSNETNRQRFDSDSDRDNIWTLTQFWRKEQIDFQNMKNSRPKFCILATVDAISPIVAMDPSNPFALIEVYDKDNTDISCVIVLHGRAMLNHAAIFPLDTLVFRDVVYKPWSVPQILNDDNNKQKKSSSSSINYPHLIGRIPSHVFVATTVDSVSWNHHHHHHQFSGNSISRQQQKQQQQKQQQQQQHDQPQIGSQSMITPVNLVTMVQGRIYHVETLSIISGTGTATVIHYVDIITLSKIELKYIDNGNNADKFVDDNLLVPELGLTKNTLSSTSRLRCRLYLSHFPMSMDIQFSLRIGAIIQANNIHLVRSHNGKVEPFSDVDVNIGTSYGACLRSTLILLKNASDAAGEEDLKEQLVEVHESTESGLKGDQITGSSSSTRSSGKSTMRLQTQFTVLCAKIHKCRGNGMNEYEDDTDNQKNGTSSDMDYTHHSIDRLLPFLNYGFRRKVDQTYLKDIYYKQVEDWVHRSFRGSLRVPFNNGVLKDFIVNVLLKCNRNNGRPTKTRCCHDLFNPSATRPKIKRRSPPRSPYAEFFDHPFNLYAPQDDDGDDMHDVSCGCHLSIEDRNYSSLRTSLLLDLNDIRVASQLYLDRQIMKLLPLSPLSSETKKFGPSNQIKTGFTGSIRVPLRELYDENFRESKESEDDHGNSEEKQNYDCFAGGFVSELHTTSSHGVSSIADEGCQIPVSFDQKRGESADINDFIIGQIDSATISCLCIGSSSNDFFPENNNNDPVSCLQSSVSKILPLPVLDQGKKNLIGNCSLVTLGGLLFVTAIQIHLRDYKVFRANDSSSDDQGGTRLEGDILSVEDCLVKQDFLSKSIKPVTLMGMLTRSRFQYKMNMDGSYKCCNIMVSSSRMDELNDLESDNSCLQALELSLSIVQNTARMIKFNQTLDNLLPGANLSQSQKVLGLSFWVLGDSGRTCALTFGGSEDIMPGSPCSKSIINVLFPSTSLELTKQGRVRSLCTNNHLDAIFISHRRVEDEHKQSRNALITKSSHLFDFVGGTKVMSGTLHRRPSRRNIFGHDHSSTSFRAIGELSTEPSTAIPICILSDLFELVYRCLREPGATQRIMNPSLVRRIVHGRLLNVSFCQVQCYCMRCMCPLVDSTTNARAEPTSTGKRKRQDVEAFDEPSFWHLPHPEEHLEGSIHSTQSCYSSVDCDNHVPQHIQISSLRCPKNDCSKKLFDVKWECSGILDDGTGQATMYADGDAALTLLGMSAENIQIIEHGVWSTRGGSLLFMKSIPPSKHLRDKVIQVLSTTRRRNNNNNQRSPMILLSIEDRAAYLLEKHCRSSSRPRRPLDYYVRCKPLVSGTKIPHMHHTKIDSFFADRGSYSNGSCTIFRGQVASYTLPPLKLELVDCGVNSF
jgi:hypothetical protein